MSSAASSALVALAQQRVLRPARPGAVNQRPGQPGELDAHLGAVARDQRDDARARGTPPAASDAHFAAAIVRFRKKWWLPAMKRAARLAAERRERRRAARAAAGCRSPGCACAARRPCCRPCAASPNTSIGPAALEQRARAAGPSSSRKKRSRSIDSSSPTPNHSVRPGPSLSVENARAATLVLDDPDRHRRRADAGHRADVVVLVAGLERDLAALEQPRGRLARSGAQPSNTHGGEQRPPLRVADPLPLDRRARSAAACPSRSPGTTVAAPARPSPRAARRPRSARPPRALAAAIARRRARPHSRVSSVDASRVAAGRRAPVDLDDRRALRRAARRRTSTARR